MKQTVCPGYLMRHTSPLTKAYSGWICLRCRKQALASILHSPAPASISPSYRRYSSSTNNPKPKDDPNSFTEKLRRMIWKQDPPGPADPYARQSITHQTKSLIKKSAVDSNVSQASSVQSEYIPASSWDGLEQIGGATGWWEEAWDRDHQFEGFMSQSKLETREDISFAIYQSLVEMHTLRKANLPLAIPKNGLDLFYKENSGRMCFRKKKNGTTALFFGDEKIQQEILDLIINDQPPPESGHIDDLEGLESTALADSTNNWEEEPQAKDQEAPTDQVEELSFNEYQTPQDSDSQESATSDFSLSIKSPDLTQNSISWFHASFNDPDIKFAILKRVMQLTGIRIPDPEIDSILTAAALLGHLVKKPKPKKLADNLASNRRLARLPNVQLMERRYTPIDREKEIGRWKMIEEELVRRDLPVTGRG